MPRGAGAELCNRLLAELGVVLLVALLGIIPPIAGAVLFVLLAPRLGWPIVWLDDAALIATGGGVLAFGVALLRRR